MKLSDDRFYSTTLIKEITTDGVSRRIHVNRYTYEAVEAIYDVDCFTPKLILDGIKIKRLYLVNYGAYLFSPNHFHRAIEKHFNI